MAKLGQLFFVFKCLNSYFGDFDDLKQVICFRLLTNYWSHFTNVDFWRN